MSTGRWKFAYPDGVKFRCQQCGDCCRGLDVPLSSGERARLETLDWRGREDRLVDAAAAVEVRTSGGRHDRLARDDDGACVFLGAEQQCLIHEHFGAAAKPLACRMYPFSFRPTGDRVAVDAAFSCRSVSHGQGEPLSVFEDGWAELLGDAATRGADRHRLTGEHRIDGDLVWEVEGHLAQFLRDRSFAMLDRIRCALQYLRIATTGDPTTAAAPTLRAVLAKGIPDQVRKAAEPELEPDKTQRAVFYLWTFLLLNRAPPDMPTWHRHELQRQRERRQAQAEAFRDNRGRPWLDNRELGVSFAAIDAVDTAFLTGAAEPVIEQFLCAKLTGQRFRFAAEEELPLVLAARRLLLTYPVLIWTAKALAAERGSAGVEDGSARAELADLRAALRLVDPSLDQLRTAALPRKQREAWEFVLVETDMIVSMARLQLGLPPPPPAPDLP